MFRLLFRLLSMGTLWVFVPMGALGAAGCTDSEPVVVVKINNPTMGRSGTFGLMVFQQYTGDQSGQVGGVDGDFSLEAFDGDGDGGLDFSAQFLHYRNISRGAAVAAIDLAVADLPADGEMGRCVFVPHGEEDQAGGDGFAPESAVAGEGESGWYGLEQYGSAGPVPFQIDLLNAGHLEVEGAGQVAHLLPREFPGFLMSLAGVIYHTGTLKYVPRGEYVITGAGSSDMGAFKVSVTAPRPLYLDAVNGVMVGGESGSMEVGLNAELHLAWMEPDPDADFVYISLSGHNGRLCCLSHDDGLFQVPGEQISRLGSGSVSLRVERVKVRPFMAPGVREAESVFIVQDEMDLVFK